MMGFAFNDDFVFEESFFGVSKQQQELLTTIYEGFWEIYF